MVSVISIASIGSGIVCNRFLLFILFEADMVMKLTRWNTSLSDCKLCFEEFRWCESNAIYKHHSGMHLCMDFVEMKIWNLPLLCWELNSWGSLKVCASLFAFSEKLKWQQSLKNWKLFTTVKVTSRQFWEISWVWGIHIYHST